LSNDGVIASDEADGPLDPDHKRMFMDMKREVLRLGRYAREFYVSQTPELTAMADHVIDLDALVNDRLSRAPTIGPTTTPKRWPNWKRE